MALKITPINRISRQNFKKTDFKKMAYLMDRFWAQSFFFFLLNVKEKYCRFFFSLID